MRPHPWNILRAPAPSRGDGRSQIRRRRQAVSSTSSPRRAYWYRADSVMSGGDSYRNTLSITYRTSLFSTGRLRSRKSSPGGSERQSPSIPSKLRRGSVLTDQFFIRLRIAGHITHRSAQCSSRQIRSVAMNKRPSPVYPEQPLTHGVVVLPLPEIHVRAHICDLPYSPQRPEHRLPALKSPANILITHQPYLSFIEKSSPGERPNQLCKR